MPLVKHIIEAHQGRIWIDSALGTGTRVSCALPRQTNVEPVAGAETE